MDHLLTMINRADVIEAFNSIFRYLDDLLNTANLLSFLFVSMKAKTNFLRCIGYLSFTKDRTKLLDL